MEIPKGLCHCGCGKKTTVWKYNDSSHGRVRGESANFIKGHFTKTKTGENSWAWKGGRHRNKGYVKIHMPEHPRTDANKRVNEHVLIVEKALGKFLPDGACVHHVDKDRSNNIPSNLVACQDTKYHRLLHQRQRAYDACGHASWRKCRYCTTYDDPKNLHWDGHCNYHNDCRNLHFRQQRKERRVNEA